MSKLVVPTGERNADGRVLSVTPQSAGWQYVGFAVYNLLPGQNLKIEASEQETCIVLLSGKATVVAGEKSFTAIGGRDDVFDGPPTAVYVPHKTAFSITSDTDLEVALCTAPGGGDYEPRLIAPGELPLEIRGVGTNTRHVQDILPESEPAHSLLVVEVITPGGHWSSYPPHKHDKDALPTESALEETYYHRLRPQQGFAFQRVYTDDRSLDETVSVHDGDCVMVPRGYHPVGAPHGYDLYYLNVMAGPQRRWVFRDDPKHAWISGRAV